MEDKNQSTVSEPVKSELQTSTSQATNNTNNANDQAGEKEGLEQEGSIKNSK